MMMKMKMMMMMMMIDDDDDDDELNDHFWTTRPVLPIVRSAGRTP